MMRITILALGVSALSLGAAAQERIEVSINDELGEITLANSAYACFDPLAAMSMNDDGAAGQPSNMTRQAFAVGSCLLLDENTALYDAEIVSIDGSNYLRGALSSGGAYLYAPDWSVAISGDGGGYDADRTATMAPMDDVATGLAARVQKFNDCREEGESISARVDAFNAKAAKLNIGDDGEGTSTGSRIQGGANSYSVTKILFPDKRYRELFDEADALNSERDDHWDRCSEFSDGIDLDKDYMSTLS